MMKCLRNPTSGEILRVSNNEGRRLARNGWTYVPKALWKQAVMQQSVAKAMLQAKGGLRRV